MPSSSQSSPASHYRPLVKDFDGIEGFDLSKVKLEKGSKDSEVVAPPSYLQKRMEPRKSTISITPASKDSSESEAEDEEMPHKGKEAETKENGDKRNEEKSEDKERKQEENEENRDENEVEKEEKVVEKSKEESEENAEDNEENTEDNEEKIEENENKANEENENKVNEENGEEKMDESEDGYEEKMEENETENGETEEKVDDKVETEDEKLVEEDEKMEESEDKLDSEKQKTPEFTDTEENEDKEEEIGDSPFKKPPDQVSIDGSSSKGGRERHFSTNSVEDCESETSENQRQSVSEEIAAQYAQQLNFYRKPIVGQDTVCMFCLTRCASKNPKVLTCLHSACEDCFKERLENAAKDKKSPEICSVDEDGCPIEPEIMVTCPLCKVSTSDKEIIDNLFLTPDQNPTEEDDFAKTYMCESCDDNNLANSFCTDCESNLCDDCVKAHKRLKSLKDHKVTPLEVQNSSANRSVTASIGTPHDLRCKKDGEKLTLYCEVCEVLTCKDCQLSEKHNGHKHRETHEVVPDVKSALGKYTIILPFFKDKN